MENMKKLYIVVPCYNEADVLNETARRLKIKLTELKEKKIISNESKIVFVNDGSKDNTWNIIKELHNENDMILGIDLSKNKGHQNALLAGLMTVKDYADMVISMDADLQDDIEAIDEMVKKYYEGKEVVYGVRSSRKKDSFFKRNTAQFFYKFMSSLGADVVYNHADYRLLSKRVICELENFKEVNLFLRGIVPMIGFDSDIVYYERNERFAGESKYPLGKMIGFALNGITSLSIRPIRLIVDLGLGIFTLSFIMLIYSLASFFYGTTVSGWSSIIISIWAIGGLQLLAIGVIGEYIGKIYLETKQRPKFIVREFLKD